MRLMDAIHIIDSKAPDGLHIEKTPIPPCPDGWLLIKVHAAGVNRPDCLQRQGLYPPPAGASKLLGLEIAGEIVECSPNLTKHDGGTWRVGDMACALSPGGGYAEYCAVPAGHALPIPTGFSMLEAAALPETFFTVYSNLFMRGMLKAGEIVLIHGGSSGIGTTAIQLAKAQGAIPIVTVRNAEKQNACLQMGAAAAFIYQDMPWEQHVMEFVNAHYPAKHPAKKGVDMVVDMVGAPYLTRNLNLLDFDGRLVQIAVQHGSNADMDLRLMMIRRLHLMGSTLRPQSITAKTNIAAKLYKHIWPLLESGQIKPIIYKSFPLKQAGMAHHLMEESQHIGKIMLEI